MVFPKEFFKKLILKKISRKQKSKKKFSQGGGGVGGGLRIDRSILLFQLSLNSDHPFQRRLESICNSNWPSGTRRSGHFKQIVEGRMMMANAGH